MDIFLKRLSFIFILLIPLTLSSCNYSLNKKKPNNFHYTNELAKCLTLEHSCSAYMIDTNFYKQKKLSHKDILVVKDFMKLLHKNNFIKKPTNLPDKPLYKIYFSFSKSKYVMNVYNERYISIYPWDGIYEMDYIDMKGIYASNNIYKLCKFIMPRY